MIPHLRVRDLLRTQPLLADAALAVFAYALLFLATRFGEHTNLSPYTLYIAAPLSAALLLRRRFPIALLAISVAGAVASLILSDGGRSALDTFAAIAAYSVAVRTPRRQAWILGATAASLLAVAHYSAGTVTWALPEVLSPALLVLTATAIGDGIRNRRAYIAASRSARGRPKPPASRRPNAASWRSACGSPASCTTYSRITSR